jgi:sulfite oxidase
MNGKTLTPAHGYPIRVIVPGVAGARSVKWLDHITVQTTESPNYYQQRDYKILPPDTETPEEAKKYWDLVPAIQEMPVNSVIAVPASKSSIKADENGNIEVRGYALPSGEAGPVIRVEISVDDGKCWSNAELLGAKHADTSAEVMSDKWAWTLWRATVAIEKGKNKRIFSRATDKGGSVQEECPKWNLRGVCYNGWGEATDVEVY